ncbi:hypothetical protein, partial [Streptococcus pneumoniae]|uniref:hypothetical protein n=1 Tax=Streptococcus pneumoniae TaxID=1313 RepID=UPI0018B0E420
VNTRLRDAETERDEALRDLATENVGFGALSDTLRRAREAERALVVCREHAVEQGRRIESLQDDRDVLRRVAIAAAADPFPTPET